MQKTIKHMIFGGALILALSPALNPALAQTLPPLGLKPVTAGVYVVTGMGGNSTFVVGPDGVVLVDTKSPGQANFDGLKAQIKSVTPFPIKEVLVTHHHPDHAGNIGLFEADGVKVVGQQGMAAALKRFPPEPDKTPSPPNVVFGSALTIRAAGLTVEAHHFAGGHSAADAVYYFPAKKLLVSGDLVDDDKPNIDFPGGGSISGWLACLDGIAKSDFDILVPGHGPKTMTKADFLAYRKKVQTLVARGRAAVKAGVPKDKLIAALHTEDLGWSIVLPLWQEPARLDGLYGALAK